MKIITILPLIMMSVTIYAGFFHLNMYLKKIDDKANLSFAFLCLFMFFYEFFSYMTYNGTTTGEISYWLKFQYAAIATLPIFYLHFVYDFTGQKTKKIPWIITITIPLAILVLSQTSFIASLQNPRTIYIGWIDFTYYAMETGPVIDIILLVLYATIWSWLIYGLVLVYRYFKARGKSSLPIFIGSICYCLTGINDTLVEQRLYDFLFLAEYGSMFMLLGMAYALISRFALLNAEIRKNTVLSAIGKMASEVVHDLTTPLDAINLAVKIAQEGNLEKKQQEFYLSLIENETRRLSDLAFNILDFVRDDYKLNIKKIDLRDFFETTLSLLKSDFELNRIELLYELEYEGPAYIDPDKFKRVIINLAANAKEGFTRKNSLPLKADSDTPLPVDAQTQEPNRFSIKVVQIKHDICFTFLDNGPGIADEMKAHLFEPFVGSGKKSGMGLGLAIVKQIVEHHGGSITFDAKRKHGALFTVILPLKTA